MKFFVGILFSGENEFEECQASIRRQTYQNFQIFIFKHLPNKEAHVTLFRTFLEHAAEYDALIKVDADMVLASDTLFEKINEKLAANPTVDVLGIAVQDFFSNQLIWGLNTYRNTVRWNFEKETIFVDIPETPPERIFYDTRELAPAAIHCKNPSPFQSFHYGVHRGLKSLEAVHGETHWNLLEKMRQNFERTRDARIGLALLGRELAYSGMFTAGDLDYTRPRLKEILAEYAEFDAAHLEHKINKLKWSNWGLVPGGLRRTALRLFHNKK